MEYWFLNFPKERQALHDINIGSWYHDYESSRDLGSLFLLSDWNETSNGD